jgi:hypothetical protein
MKKELTPIQVDTLPNGYALQVYDKKYMYFNESELFDGLVYHAGMAIMKENDQDVIREIVANLFAGDIKVLMERNQAQQAEIAKLEARVRKLQDEKTKIETKVRRYEKRAAT